MSSGCSEADNNTNYSKHSLALHSVLPVVHHALQHPMEIRCCIFWL